MPPATSSSSRPWPVRVRRLLPWLLFSLLPSFVQHKLYPSLKYRQDSTPHPTAFLDGIRGVAALFVYFHHLYFVTHDVSHAYGKDNDLFSSLPIIRLLVCGHSIVSLFFVVSGFALSVKPLRLMKSRDWYGLHVALSSSVARRALRLYLPCITSTFIVLVLLRFRIYEYAGRYIATNPRILTAFREKHPVRQKTLFLELQFWIGALLGIFNPWTKSTGPWHPIYDPHLWSVVAEFKASLMLFVVQLGVSRLIPAARRTCLCILILWCFFKSWWTAIFFYSGFLIADFDISNTSIALPTIKHPNSPSSNPQSRIHTYQTIWLRFRKIIWLSVFTLGLYTASAPQDHFERTYGFQTLGHLTPPPYRSSPTTFWTGLGAILIVWSTTNSPTLKHLFTARPIQYLGRISFSIYLVHGPTIHTLGYALLKTTWTMTGLQTARARETGFFVAAAGTTAGMLWAAEVFARAVDAPAKRFARWAERVCSVDGGGGDGVALGPAEREEKGWKGGRRGRGSVGGGGAMWVGREQDRKEVVSNESRKRESGKAVEGVGWGQDGGV